MGRRPGPSCCVASILGGSGLQPLALVYEQDGAWGPGARRPTRPQAIAGFRKRLRSQAA